MGAKHGEWFELTSHLQIHNEVIHDYCWLIKSGQTEYDIDSIDLGSGLEIKHNIQFDTHNNYRVEISKRTITSTEKPPRYGLTIMFRYRCFAMVGNYQLMYHSAHSDKYNPNAPWHLKPHRHEFDGKVQRISIYADDFRPPPEKTRKYTWEGHPVELTFFGHEEWPFVKEFLEEVSILKLTY